MNPAPSPALRRLTRQESQDADHDLSESEDFPHFRLEVPGARIDFEQRTGHGQQAGNASLFVLTVGTEEGSRRQGKATALVRALLAYSGRGRIEWGEFTEDGQRWLRHVVERETRLAQAALKASEAPAATEPIMQFQGQEGVFRVEPGNAATGGLPRLFLRDRVSGEGLFELPMKAAAVVGGTELSYRRTEFRVSVYRGEGKLFPHTRFILQAVADSGCFEDITERPGTAGPDDQGKRIFNVTDPDLARRCRAAREQSSVVGNHDRAFTAVYVHRGNPGDGLEYERVALLENRPDLRNETGVSLADEMVAALRRGGDTVYAVGMEGAESCPLTLSAEDVEAACAQTGRADARAAQGH